MLKIKNVLITGASGDIGAEIARAFAMEGYRLFLVYKSGAARIKKLAKVLSESGAMVHTFKCDLALPREVKVLVDGILADFKHIDVLINSAGVSSFSQVQDITEKDYNFIFDNNLKSTIFTTKYVAKNMISNHGGKIINISSIWGKVGASMESLYSASKGAINAFTLSLAKELGPSGVTVNAVCPGFVDTRMNKDIDEAARTEFVAQTPLGRLGETSDVAGVVAFLASEKADFLTGQILLVDGGHCL